MSDFRKTGKRPDFVLSSQEGTVQIIEIKRPQHKLSNLEMDRIISYYDNMKAFLEDSGHAVFRQHFSDFHETVVCDRIGLTGAQRTALDAYLERRKLTHMTWASFLLKLQRVHQDSLSEARRQREAEPAAPSER